jgi:CheY-like chemotaxis protein
MKSKVPKLLIVEDHPHLGPALKRTFEAPAQRQRDAFAIDRFTVDLATNRAHAEALLKKAADSFQPYDVLLLDLEIPESEGQPAKMDEGFKILPLIRDPPYTQVVLNSQYINLKKLHKPVQSGIFDYIIKQDRDKLDDDGKADALQTVINAYRKGLLRQKSMWEEFLRKRSEQWRLFQTCARMVDYVSQIVTDGVGRLREHGRNLGDLLAARYELRPEHDAGDPLCQAVQQIMDDADRISAEIPGVRHFLGDASLEEEEELLREGVVEDLVRAGAAKCLPGLAFKGLSLSHLPQGRHEARIFSHDIEMILYELICNAIEVSESGQEISVDVVEMRGSQGERTIEVRVEDQAPSLEKRIRDAIAANRPLGIKDGRGWGLSLAQRVAENSGAWIDIQETPSGVGNTVILHIPVAS